MKRTVTILATAMLLGAACGGGEETVSAAPVVVVEGASADGNAAAATEPASTDEEAALEFAQCMRDEGIDFADPTIDADGSVSFFGDTGPQGAGLDPNDPALTDAADVCGDIIAGASFLPGAGDTTELEDNLLDFAQCLRDEGLDVDDPDLSGGFGPGAGGGGGLFGDNFDPNDPAASDAIDACAGVFGASGPFGGGN